MKKASAAMRRIKRVRAKISGTAKRPRLAVRRSLMHIYAQLIDDVSSTTIVAASDKDVKVGKMTKLEVATEVGKVLADRANSKKISVVVFDRRDKKYHGRVKALADGARANGLQF